MPQGQFQPPVFRSKLQQQLTGIIREGMKRRDMTQIQLSDISGVHPNTVSKMLNGRVEGYLGTWQRLLDAVGFEVRT